MAVSEQPHVCGFALGSGPSQGPLPRSRDAEWKGVRALDLGVGNPVSQSGSECEHWPDSDASILSAVFCFHEAGRAACSPEPRA